MGGKNSSFERFHHHYFTVPLDIEQFTVLRHHQMQAQWATWHTWGLAYIEYIQLQVSLPKWIKQAKRSHKFLNKSIPSWLKSRMKGFGLCLHFCLTFGLIPVVCIFSLVVPNWRFSEFYIPEKITKKCLVLFCTAKIQIICPRMLR